VGSITLAASIARFAFLALLLWGWATGALRGRALVGFVSIGVAAWMLLPRLQNGDLFVTPALAVVDIALVFAIFKGDVRIG
jgi:hypothetical protein